MTPVSLKEHFDDRLAAAEKLAAAQLQRIDGELAAVRKEIEDFKDQTKDSFVKTNEFRGSLDDQNKTMATRREFETLTIQVSELRSRLDKGPSGLQQVQDFQNIITGQGQGRKEGRSDLYALIAVVAAALTILSRFFP